MIKRSQQAGYGKSKDYASEGMTWCSTCLAGHFVVPKNSIQATEIRVTSTPSFDGASILEPREKVNNERLSYKLRFPAFYEYDGQRIL